MLTTERLRLRPLGEGDLDLALAHWSVPEVGRWLFDARVPSRRQVAADLAKSAQAFADHGFGIWGLYRRDGGAFIGTCGLLPVPEGTREVEILFSIEPGCWRRGYAREASLAVLDHGFGTLGLDEVVGRCDVPNEPSRRLLEQLGMTFEKRAPIKGIDCFHYRLRRQDFRGVAGARDA